MDSMKDFAWGVATAAFQIEGVKNGKDKGLDVWEVFTHEPDRIYGRHNADVACDHYNKYKEDIALMRENGLDIALGTDSLSSNDDLDMMKELVCLHTNFPEVPMPELFQWASLNGARFLGKDGELGTLTPGKHPGVVFITDVDADGCITGTSRSRRLI